MTQLESQQRQGWGVPALTLALYPFGAGAMAINLYFAGLILSFLDLPVPAPVWALVFGALLGVPATWFFARHIRALMDRADAAADAENAR